MILIDELVKLKDHEFDRLLDISEDELKFSNGWITNYKKQNSLHWYKLHSETASALLEIYTEWKNKTPETYFPIWLGRYIQCQWNWVVLVNVAKSNTS